MYLEFTNILIIICSIIDSLGGLQFGIDENGNYGYIKAGADSVTPFKSGLSSISRIVNYNSTRLASYSKSVELAQGEHYLIVDGQYQLSGAQYDCGVTITGCTVENIGNNIYKTTLDVDTTVTFTITASSTNTGNGESINIYDILL